MKAIVRDKYGSADVLELDGGVLVPLVADAVTAVDVTRRTIEVDERFLGLDPPHSESERR